MKKSLADKLENVKDAIISEELIRKENIHRVYPSDDENKNKAIVSALRKIDSLANVVIIPSGCVLSEYMETPFMKTPKGKRVVGVKEIQQYATSLILERPVLFFSSSEECREAYLAIIKSGINCEFRAPAEDTTPPVLLHRYTHYKGINEIKDFIEEHKNA